MGCNVAYKKLRDDFIQSLQPPLEKGEGEGPEVTIEVVHSADDQQGFRVLASQFSAVLAAVSTARKYSNNRTKNISVLEAETRRPWDSILDIACFQMDDNDVSANLLYVTHDAAFLSITTC